jgi:hypothetical protein
MILTGFALVIVTWGLALLVVVGIGFLPASLVSPRSELRVVVCRAMWWGLLGTAIASYLINLIAPLRSLAASLALLALALLSAVAGVLLRRRTPASQVRQLRARASRNKASRSLELSLLAFQIALVAGVLYLAFAALGPVTNYDSGLYHLGAIQYATEYPTVPGLANIFPALGYGNAEFPLAALMSNGPLGANGFRTLNGFVMLLLVIDVILRIRGRRFGAGFFVLVTGVTAAMVPMVALSDYWMTSPSQDSTVMLITVVASAYLVDALARRKSWMGSGATALSLCILLVLLRPTMIIFAATTLGVLAVIAWKRRKSSETETLRLPLMITLTAGVIALIAATARDYVLSGWFQYPLSVHAFAVEWLAPDPASERLATLGYHRNPDDIWGSINDWDWVPSWISRVPTQWETYEFLSLAVLAVMLIVVAASASPRVSVRWRLLALAIVPSAIGLFFWWVATPPSFRFTWGPLFMLPAIVIGWLLAGINRAKAGNVASASGRFILVLPAISLGLMAAALIATVAYSAVSRLDLSSASSTYTWGPLSYAVTPPQIPDVAEGETNGGVKILQPTQGEQCWAEFPVCTPRLMDSVAPRGSDIREGFLP